METYSNTELLTQFNLPILHNLEDLSYSIGLSKKILFLFSNQKINKKFYSFFEITKKNGNKRKICAPNHQLKLVQKWILVNILSKLNVSDRAKAFCYGINGIKENAELHKTRLYLLEIDIKDFFNNIKRDRVYTLFRRKGYCCSIAGILANICTFDGYLPQGGICSPILSNLVCNSLDKRIIGLCDKRDIMYSRYADDMTFSSNEKSSLRRILPLIEKIIKEEGFELNKNKTRFLSPGSKKCITGITINGNNIKVSKALKRNLRVLIHKSIVNADYSNTNKIKGLVAFINSIEPSYKEKIIEYISNLSNKQYIYIDKHIVTEFNKNKFYKEITNYKYYSF